MEDLVKIGGMRYRFLGRDIMSLWTTTLRTFSTVRQFLRVATRAASFGHDVERSLWAGSRGDILLEGGVQNDEISLR